MCLISMKGSNSCVARINLGAQKTGGRNAPSKDCDQNSRKNIKEIRSSDASRKYDGHSPTSRGVSLHPETRVEENHNALRRPLGFELFDPTPMTKGVVAIAEATDARVGEEGVKREEFYLKVRAKLDNQGSMNFEGDRAESLTSSFPDM